MLSSLSTSSRQTQFLHWWTRGGRDHKSITAEQGLSKQPTVIKDVLHSDLCKEQSCSKPCFDSLFCAEEMRTQGELWEEITSLVALKNCCGFCPQNYISFTPWIGHVQKALSSQFIKIYKERFTLPVPNNFFSYFLKTIGISVLWVPAFSDFLCILLGLSKN